LLRQGRTIFTFNSLRRVVAQVGGFQRKSRLSPIAIPAHFSDQEAADEITDLLLHVFSKADALRTISDCFEGALKTAWNLATVYIDYNDDPINGSIKFGREPYSGFILDPFFTQMSLSDCRFAIRRKYISSGQACALLPEFRKDIKALAAEGFKRDEKFTWLPQVRLGEGQKRDLVSYDEYYRQVFNDVHYIADKGTGDFQRWEGSEKDLKEIRKRNLNIEIITKSEKSIECHILVNNIYLKTEVNQFGLNEYPFVPFVYQYDPEGLDWGLKLQSMISPLLDIQKEMNKSVSQMKAIVESQIHAGFLVEDGSLVNPMALHKTGAGRQIFRKKGTAADCLTPLPVSPVDSSLLEIVTLFEQKLLDIAGLNKANFGEVESGHESGLLMMLRQGSSENNLQGPLDNLRHSQSLLAEKVLKIIQAKWTPEKIAKVLGRQPSPQIYSKEYIEHSIDFQEGLLTNNSRQLHFAQMMELYNLTGGPEGRSPITANMLVQAAPLQGLSKLNREIAENEKQQQQVQKASEQAQAKVLEAELEQAKAISLERAATAQEKFSKASDDRASAILDKAKAIKELESMDQEKLNKYITMIQQLESMMVQQEENVQKANQQQTKTQGVSNEENIGQNNEPNG